MEARLTARPGLGEPMAPSTKRNKSFDSPRASNLASLTTPGRRKSTDTLPSLSSRSRTNSSVNFEEVKREEEDARNRVARLKAQISRSERLERELHVEEVRKKRRDQAMAPRTQDVELAARFANTKPSSDDEILLLAGLFKEHLGKRYREATRCSGDDDCSIPWLLSKTERHHGMLSFAGFTRMTREVLGLSEQELTESRLLSLWLTGLQPPTPPPPPAGKKNQPAPDRAPREPVTPASLVTLRGIAQFIKLGAKQDGTDMAERARQVRERIIVEKRNAAKAVRADITDRIRAPPSGSSGALRPEASPGEVRTLAELMNQQMAILFSPNERTFFRLFKFMDTDGSGMIEFDEFEHMIRKVLCLSTDALPQDRLLGLWHTIDADKSGRICQGEWGRFMRFGCAEACKPDSWIKFEEAPPDSPPASHGAVSPRLTPRRTRILFGNNPMADDQARIRAQRAKQRDRDESEREILRRVKENSRSLDAEAQRLEALLAEKERARR